MTDQTDEHICRWRERPTAAPRFSSLAASCMTLMTACIIVMCDAGPAPAQSEICAPGAEARNAGMPPWFQSPQESEILEQIARTDTVQLRRHAAMVWAALTDIDTSKPAKVPFFETWPTKEQTFRPDSAVGASPFSVPTQSSRNKATIQRLETAGLNDGKVFAAVHYNCAMYRHIRDHGLHRASAMQAINVASQSRPVAEREVPFFPRSSIMIKAAFQVVSHRRPTTLAYWTGPHRSQMPNTPGPTTWLDRIVVVPPGSPQPPADGSPIVNLDRFFSRPLGAADVARLKAELKMNDLEEGDFAILAAMHIATRETPNWTWQTFWWSFQKPQPPAGLLRKVPPPFDNYELEVGYDFMAQAGNATGLPQRAFNPYLEAEFGEEAFSRPGQRGIESNCMSCHRAAAWPGRTAGFVANGWIRKDDPFFFSGNTKTDYVWGIPENIPEP